MYTFAMSVGQSGADLYGETVISARGAHGRMSFVGRFENGYVVLHETQLIESGGGWFWCDKTARLQLWAGRSLRLAGPWSAQSVWYSPRTSPTAYACPPGQIDVVRTVR